MCVCLEKDNYLEVNWDSWELHGLAFYKRDSHACYASCFFFFSFFSPSEATHYLDSGHGLVLEEIL